MLREHFHLNSAVQKFW